MILRDNRSWANSTLVAAPVVCDILKNDVGHLSMNEYAAMERVLIVDDHALVRDGLRSLIAVSFDQCEIQEAADFEEALAMVERQSNFDLVMLDLNIPDTSGLNGLRTMRARFPALPVVMVSGTFDRQIVQEALAIGAAGFIPKSLKRNAIVHALRSVLAGEIYIPDMIHEETEASRAEEEIRARIVSLTPQQKIVLNHLVNGRLNKQIAHDLGVSMTTVKAHVSAILLKLGVFNRTQAVIKANLVHFNQPL